MNRAIAALIAATVACLACAANGQEAGVTAIYGFGGPVKGRAPEAPVIQGSDGNFYGTTSGGGAAGTAAGTIFKITPAGVLTTLYTFTGVADGESPEGLTQGSDGNFYGTTSAGGNGNGSGGGTIFKITPAGVLTTLYAFTGGADGESPEGLTQGSDGNFYGTTYGGGSGIGDNGEGTIFKITPAGVLTTLYTFTGRADGATPEAGVIQGSDGNFYGTTEAGGSGIGGNGDGTIFKITPAGVLTTLYTFTGADGESPEAGLIQGSDGNFYGTTYGGGSNGEGTVFQITPAGVLTTLWTFTFEDGAFPRAGLTLGSDGNFYGTASEGGNDDYGTVFKITPAGVFTDLYDFTGGADGATPEAGLTLGSDGNFYGTASEGGSGVGYNGDGTVFKITPAGVFSTLFAFPIGIDGANPGASLTQGSDGNFYGTTFGGGDSNEDGTVFKITPAGDLTTLYTFTGGADGSEPEAGLAQGSDGNFYGTTEIGGSNGDGTVFQITPAGVLTTLYTFTGGADGANPEAGLTQGSDGNFYGTTTKGGSGYGTIFQITPAGVFTALYSFTGGADGATPLAVLTQGSDGDFYGTTEKGGSSGYGTVFKITPAGVLSTLYTFTGGADGATPEAGLTQGSDGNFYGTTNGGGNGNGIQGSGTVFKITPAGVLTTLYTFTGSNDGAYPVAGLTQGNDGNFYGTTQAGGENSGNNGYGTAFQITPAGVLTTLHIFLGYDDGEEPRAGLTLGNDGNFYGTTYGGGQNSDGVVFRLTVAPVVTSDTETAQVGSAFSYQIVATNNPTSYDDYGLPPGLSLNASTGLISGTPTQSGTFFIDLYADNSGGEGDGSLTLTVSPAGGQAPAVTSDTASAQVGSAFSFQIVATNSPTSFGATGLPAGLSVNASTGLISGTPTQSGMFSVGLTATNSGGTGNGTLSLTVSPAPVQPPAVTSETATAQVGSAFSFQIVATNSPTSFGATGLPAGLSVNASTGLISGTPSQSGTFTVGLTATNSAGTGSGTLSLTVSPAPVQPPAVTSDTATAQVGSAFSFQIVATNSPTSFGATGLPAGLSVDAVAGLISGTPTQSGTFTVGLTAANSGGTGTGTLSLTVTPAPPQEPTITLTSPPIDETVVTGSTVPLAATVNDPDGILSQVQFFLNGAAVAPPLTAAPFTASAVAPAPGTYMLQATATDNEGRQSTSSHTLTVIAAATDPAAPSADLITDVNNRKIGAGDTIVLTCTASSADGSPIQMVNFYANGTLFASVDGNGNPIALSASLPGSGALVRDAAAASTNTLFQASFQVPISGSSASNQYNLLAIAFSKLGTAQTSSTVTVTAIPQSVDQPPQIALAGLTNGQVLTTGKSYTASTVPGETTSSAPAIASAPAGSLSTVAKIEYYLNKIELASASVTGGAVPNFTFTAPAPGEYIVEAIATDSAGVASVADPITVQIDPLPAVSVSALGDGEAVVGGKKAKVLISRTGDTSSELKVSYKLSGTAVNGVDYQLAPASRKIVIPAGSASVKIKIDAIADPAAASSLSAKIKLTAPSSGAYALGSPSSAKITILQH